ncbi:glycosyltransferase family 2 protein [Comamonas aquatica]|nr:glycosyltransferase family 2 protein [Comamonas aquatica]
MNFENLPLVTVIVPAYNHEKFIEQCIRSIFAQTYSNYEVVVINDGSKDRTLEILEELNKEFDFNLVNQKNSGCAAALNSAIKNFSNGDFVSICASDDYWDDSKLSKQVDFMLKHEKIPFCFNKNYFVDEYDRVVEDATRLANNGLKGGHIFKDIIFQNFHPLPGYIFRKKVFEDVGLYREDVWTEDFYMNLRISEKYEIGFIDEFLSFYRYPTNFNKKLISRKVSDAHKLCIDQYKESVFYDEAVLRWNYRNFMMYSGVKEMKYLAVNGMWNSIVYFYKWNYIKSLIRLILFWK